MHCSEKRSDQQSSGHRSTCFRASWTKDVAFGPTVRPGQFVFSYVHRRFAMKPAGGSGFLRAEPLSPQNTASLPPAIRYSLFRCHWSRLMSETPGNHPIIALVVVTVAAVAIGSQTQFYAWCRLAACLKGIAAPGHSQASDFVEPFRRNRPRSCPATS
jgi:hypothetical protein